MDKQETENYLYQIISYASLGYEITLIDIYGKNGMKLRLTGKFTNQY